MSTHEDFEREEHVKGSSNRAFGLVFAVVFFLIGLFPLIKSGSVRFWSLGIGAAFLAVSFLRPAILQPLNALWTRFGLFLNKIISPVMLGVLFYLVVTPVGMMMRFFSGNPMRPDFDPKADSYWIKRDPPGPKPESMSDQF